MDISRKQEVRNCVDLKGEIKLKELEQIFDDVSSMTLRRDLAQLEEEGYLIRVRGGAKSVEAIKSATEENYNLRATENLELKIIIARKALGLIESGRSIFLDSGTTSMEFAKQFPDKNLSILTSGPNIAIELLKMQNLSVMLTGGQLKRNNISLSGIGSLEFIHLINIDVAFMATSGFSIEAGLTCGDYNECELKKAVIKKAKKVILLMDTTKVDKNLPYTFAELKDINIIVTDQQLPKKVQDAAKKEQVVLL